MSNRECYDFELPFGGRTFHFYFGFCEIMELQNWLSTPEYVPKITEIDVGIKKNRLKYQQGLIWSGLRRFHRDVTTDGVAELMEKASAEEFLAVLAAFHYSVTPDPVDVEALGPSVNPPAAQIEKTGASSIYAPVAPA